MIDGQLPKNAHDLGLIRGPNCNIIQIIHSFGDAQHGLTGSGQTESSLVLC